MCSSLFASLAISFLCFETGPRVHVRKLSWSLHEKHGRQLRSLCGSQTRLQVLPIPVHQEWLFLLFISIFLYLGHMPQSGYRKDQQTTRHCRSVQSALYQVAHSHWPPEPFRHPPPKPNHTKAFTSEAEATGSHLTTNTLVCSGDNLEQRKAEVSPGELNSNQHLPNWVNQDSVPNSMWCIIPSSFSLFLSIPYFPGNLLLKRKSLAFIIPNIMQNPLCTLSRH